MLVWIETDDFDLVEDAIEADPAISGSDLLTEVDGRRLYRVEFSELGEETDLLPELIEVGAVLQSVIGTNEGWTLRGRFPNRTALDHIYQFCRNHQIDIRIDAVYDQRTWTKDGLPTLTEPQREILVEAVESGYLSIPRECSLATLAERLDISESAASERFRRAVGNLIEQTVL